MTLPIRAGIALLTLGSVGGATYGAISYFQQGTEITKLIEQEFQYVLLDTKEGTGNEDATQWATNWENYKKANKNNTKDFFELQGWNKDSETNLKDVLRKKCATLSKLKVQSTKENLYKNITNYCGRPVAIKDQVKRDNLSIITTKNNDIAWTKVEQNKSNLGNHFTNLRILATSGNTITKENIRDGCEKAINKNKSEAEYLRVYNSYKEVCVDKKNNDIAS